MLTYGFAFIISLGILLLSHKQERGWVLIKGLGALLGTGLWAIMGLFCVQENEAQIKGLSGDSSAEFVGTSSFYLVIALLCFAVPLAGSKKTGAQLPKLIVYLFCAVALWTIYALWRIEFRLP